MSGGGVGVATGVFEWCVPISRGIFRAQSYAPAPRTLWPHPIVIYHREHGALELRPVVSSGREPSPLQSFLDAPSVLPSCRMPSVRRPEWCFAIVTATISAFHLQVSFAPRQSSAQEMVRVATRITKAVIN